MGTQLTVAERPGNTWGHRGVQGVRRDLGNRWDRLMTELCSAWQEGSCSLGLLGTQMTAVLIIASSQLWMGFCFLGWLQAPLRKLQEKVPALGPEAFYTVLIPFPLYNQGLKP